MFKNKKTYKVQLWVSKSFDFFNPLLNLLVEILLKVLVYFLECQVGTSLAGECYEVFGTFFYLMKFNGDQGAGEHHWLDLLLNWLLFCLLIRILLFLLLFYRLVIHQFSFEFELPGLFRNGDVLILGFDEIVEDGHDVEWF